MSTTSPTYEPSALAGVADQWLASRRGCRSAAEAHLVVEDDAVMRELIARVVSARRNTPVRARSEAQALEPVVSGPFDLVLTDLDTNGLGGLDLLAQLSTRTNSPPTLVITACDSAGELRARSPPHHPETVLAEATA